MIHQSCGQWLSILNLHRHGIGRIMNRRSNAGSHRGNNLSGGYRGFCVGPGLQWKGDRRHRQRGHGREGGGGHREGNQRAGKPGSCVGRGGNLRGWEGSHSGLRQRPQAARIEEGDRIRRHCVHRGGKPFRQSGLGAWRWVLTFVHVDGDGEGGRGGHRRRGGVRTWR